MVNMIPDPVYGAVRRKGSKSIADLEVYRSRTEYRFLDRGVDEQYLISFASDVTKAWDLSGNSVPVIQDGPTDDYLLGERADNEALEPEVWDVSGGSVWSSATVGSPTGLVFDQANANGFTYTPDGIAVLDGARTMEVTTTSAGTADGGTLSNDSSLTLGDNDFIEVSVYVRASDLDPTRSHSVTLGVTLGGTATINLQSQWSDTSSDWTFTSTSFTGGLTAASVESSRGVAESGETFSGWRRTAIRINVATAKAEGSLTSSSTVVAKASVLGVLTNTGDTRYTNFWGLKINLDVESIENFPLQYFETADIKTLPVGNGIYVLNPSRVVRKTSAVSDSLNEKVALLWIKAINYSVVYTLRVKVLGGSDIEKKVVTVHSDGNKYYHLGEFEGTGGSFTLEGNTVSNPGFDDDGAVVVALSTEAVAEGLLAQTAGSFSSLIGKQEASVMVLAPNTADGFEYIELEDNFGDNFTVVLWESVDTDDSLPKHAPHKFKIKLIGDPETEVDDSYVEFIAENEAATDIGDPANVDIGEGFWIETLADGIETDIDSVTMPHLLQLKEDDSVGTATGKPFQKYFSYGAQTYTSRLVGDDDSNPFPAFVSTDTSERTISSMFFVDDRIGFTSRNDVAMSSSGDLLNFFRPTVKAILPSEPLVFEASHKNATEIYDTVVSQGEVILLTKKVHFIVKGEPVFAPETLSIRPLTEFDADDRTQAHVTQFAVLIPYSRERFSGVNELLQTQADSPFDVLDATEAVPLYIGGRILHIDSTAVNDIISFLPKASGIDYGRRMYLVNSLWRRREKFQQSWHEWTISNTDQILRQFHSRDNIYVLVERDSRVILEQIELDISDQFDSSYALCLDGYMGPDQYTVDYDVTNPGETTITFPVQPDKVGGFKGFYNRTTTEGDKGTELDLTLWTENPGDKTLRRSGDFTDEVNQVVFGYPYESKIEFHEPFLLEQSQLSGLRARIIDDLALQRCIFRLRGVYDLDFTSSSTDWGTYTDEYPGLLTGTVPTLGDGAWEVGAMGPAQQTTLTLSSSDVFPFTIISAEFIVTEGIR
jgi:hypothetical protein